ncbi:peptidase domain-containing ABC transporter [Ancylomarina salipaludis]|uniref:Peptidase domain-containing ABC transporter n=1 Tax=Ancylomarina salipaludis TaxID=2501299 RepID=A0A4Q1JQB9_9BACT|nr:peptidase domain-containing ABC transporter [Ancylomarina salipaludis]RXQ97398.1 peptidase domain-containing ABC transporter [Ancylomarina salipaludis]
MSKFPVFIQRDATDCGPSCLKIISKYYKQYLEIDFLRKITHKSKLGVSLLSISDAAEKVGFRTLACKVDFDQIAENEFLPCVAHWNQNHFVVIYKIKKGKVFISDPNIGLVEYSKEEFLKCWATKDEIGVVLLFEPTPKLYTDEFAAKKKKNFSFLLDYILPYKKLIYHLLLAFLVGSGLSLIFPFLSQAIVDIGISSQDLDFVIVILIAQVILVVSQTSIGFIRNWIMLHVSVRISISLVSDFLIKLMKLPIRYFDTRMIGDIRQRIDDNERIQTFLTHSLISMSFGFFTFIIFSFVLAIYKIELLLIFYCGSALYIAWILLFMKRRRMLDYKRFSVLASEQSNIYQLITGMQEIKLNNCEKEKRWEWERIQMKLFKVKTASLMLNQNQQAGSLLINQLKNVLISYITARSVITGEISLGIMVAVQYIVGQLNAPITEFIGFLQAAQDAKMSLERIGEIHEEEEELVSEVRNLDIFEGSKDIVINDLSFTYDGPHSLKVLDKISLKIPNQKMTAIVGASGSGKTTMLKLLLGYYKLSPNTIQLGDMDLFQYNLSKWREKCGCVMQDGIIFSDTIRKNIVIKEEEVDEAKFISAIETANLHEFVSQLPLGYNTKIGQEGKALSEGQKQRILIARAVYKDPDYLFFDEATNSLDAQNEKEIVEKLNSFILGRTVVIVAHRLSTIRNADQIIVLNKGKISEIGSHSNLLDQQGDYYHLVKNQLEFLEV